MSKFLPMPLLPAPIPEAKFAWSNDNNIAQGLRRVGAAYNYVSAYARKQIFAHCNYSTPTPPGVTADESYFLFRTGENVDSIDVILGMRSASPGNTSSAYCEMILYDGTNTLTSDKMYYTTLGLLVNDVQWARTSITVTDHTLLPNTVYKGWIRQKEYARVKSVCVFETGAGVTDSTDTGVCDPLNWATNKPVYDAGVQDLAETGTKLFQHNGAQLIQWSRETAANAPTVSTTTAVNILDTSVTAWAATSPGFVLNTQYLDSLSADVTIELGVLATRIVGTTDTLTVTVKRNGSTIITRSGIATGASPMDTSTHTITARASDKVDIYFETTGTDEWRLDAVGLWLYEA